MARGRDGTRRRERRSRKCIELDPTSAKAYENLGVDEFTAGELDAAGRDLARALELDPALAGAHNALAAVLMRQGRTTPRSRTGIWRYGSTRGCSTRSTTSARRSTMPGRHDEARPYLERFVREAPPARYAADIARLRALLAGAR